MLVLVKILIENFIKMYNRDYPDLISIEKPYKSEEFKELKYTNMSKMMLEITEGINIDSVDID